MSTEKWRGYATRRDGAVKWIYADVPEGDKPYDHLAPLVPTGFKLQGFGPVEDDE